MGRPTSLTEETQAVIESAIAIGGTFEASANAGGIAYNTFNEWMKRGAAELTRRQSPRVKENTEQWNKEQPYVEFYEVIKKAKAERQLRWLSQIEKESVSGNWQAAAWKLERTEPENFGRNRVDVQLSGKDGDPIQFVFGGVDLKDDI